MILYISDTDNKRKKQKAGIFSNREFLIYLGAAAFVLVFSIIYEHFSHGVHSEYMTKAFLIPLAGGIVSLILHNFPKNRENNRCENSHSENSHRENSRRKNNPGRHEMAEAFLAGGVIWLTLGSIFQGVLEIYGTTNHITIWFLIIGVLQLMPGLFLMFIECSAGRL